MSPVQPTSPLGVYLPLDRYWSLVRNESIPGLAEGAVLFADICGFTPLTEKLVADLGADRGAEELSHLLNLVYNSLIAQVELYQGSVIYFSGDAITCWWAAEQTSLSEAIEAATSAAFALQTVIAQVGRLSLADNRTSCDLGLKVSLAAGTVRRFVVGQPEIQLLDVIAGEPLDRLALADGAAREGEIVAAPEVCTVLAQTLDVTQWRTSTSKEGELRLGVLGQLRRPAPTRAWPPLPATDASLHTQLRQWLLPPVAQRLESGLGDFLTELRPAVALFISFDGLDYTQDNTELQLNKLVCQVQTELQRYEGSLLQLTVGDKGTYLYATFGALIAHQDDAERAVRTGLALLAGCASYGQLRIGVSLGTMRAGTYGSRSRSTYGVLGDEVNLAARLMQAALPNQMLISERVRKKLGNQFQLRQLPPLKVKGKARLLTVFQCSPVQSLKGSLKSAALLTNAYQQPIWGRQAELELIRQKIQQVMDSGQGQVLEIIGGAGIGKSRLLAEAIRMAEGRGDWRIYVGQGQSFGTQITYLAWQNLFREYFGLEAEWSALQQITHLEQELKHHDPRLAQRLPLLGSLLALPIEDNSFSRHLEPAIRKSALEELIVELLQAPGLPEPLLLILEDCHWLDPLSHDLLEALCRTNRLRQPVLILTTARPAEGQSEAEGPTETVAGSNRLWLGELKRPDAHCLVSTCLEERLGARLASTPEVVERLVGRAEGNPFYLEELVNWLCDHYHPDTEADLLKLLNSLETVWPESLHSLVLSRLDRLSESEKAILKIASVIGRTFQAGWVWGVYPGVGEPGAVLKDLQHLEKLDITPLDPARPELAYSFKHMITHEVAYQSLLHAQKEELHQAAGVFIEQQYEANFLAEQVQNLPLDLLAYHYGRSSNRGKQRRYLALAGQKAQADFATATALAYYQQLNTLLEAEIKRVGDPPDKHPERELLRLEWLETNYQLGRVFNLVGRWPEAETSCRRGLARLEEGFLGDAVVAQAQRIRLKLNLAGVLIMQSRYPEATQEIESTVQGDAKGLDLAHALSRLGWISLMQCNYEQGQAHLEKSLALYGELNDQAGIASVHKNLSSLETSRGNGQQAHYHIRQALELYRRLDDRQGVAVALNTMGTLLIDYNGDLAQARGCYEESLALNQEMGNRRTMAYNLNNLGVLADRQGDYVQAQQYYAAQLDLRRELGDTRGLILALYNLGVITLNYLNKPDLAQAYFEEGLVCGQTVGDKFGRAISQCGLGCVAFVQQNYSLTWTFWQESLTICSRIGAKSYTLSLLTLIAALALKTGQPDKAALLCGCVKNQLELLNVSLDTLLDTATYKVYDQTLQVLQDLLSGTSFETVFNRGAKLDLEAAVQFALS